MQHDDGVFLHGGHAGDQVVLAVGQAHVLAVVALALKAVGQARKDDGHVGGLGGFDGPEELGLLALVAVGRVALDIFDGAAARAGRVERAVDAPGIDMAGPAALVARRGRKAADVHDLLPGGKGQRAAVLQKHRALGGHGGRGIVVARKVELGGRFGGEVGPAQHNVEQAGDRLVKHRLGQRAVLDGGDDLLVVDAAAGGHLELASRP